MQAIVSILPQPYFDQVEALWDELEAKFGLVGIRITSIPHFSWQIAETYREEQFVQTIQSIASESAPFEVHVRGVENFFSQHPVVFLKVLKDTTLIKHHIKIWMKFLPIAKGLNFLYSPVLWRPHISLTYQDLALDHLKAVMTFLKAKQIDWTFGIDNLSLVSQSDSELGQLQRQFNLSG